MEMINNVIFISVNNVTMRWKERNRKCCGIYYIKVLETYCLSRKKNTAIKNSSVRRTKQNRSMLTSNSTF